MYGEDVFRPFPSLFQSEVDARKRARTINYEDLEARARDYAKVCGVVPGCWRAACDGAAVPGWRG